MRFQERVGCLDLERPREQEALAHVALLPLQRPELIVILDPLCQRLEVQRLAQTHERVDQGSGSLEAATPRMNERSIFSASTENWRR